jgi:hypothetical protein
MCAKNQPYSAMKHALVSAYGKSWPERLLVMFTAYIDDAGTDPKQDVAIATALIVPAHRLIAFESEWNRFTEKWGIKDFHSSRCAVANSKSDFAGWDDAKVGKAFKRIRQIIRKYGLRSFSLSVHKPDYDAIVPAELRPKFGKYHYTYAIQNALAFLDRWACQTGVEYPLEFIFDWMDPKTQKPEKQEIENALARSEEVRPGRFAGHYSFRRRQEVPGLQCVDLVGWTCYWFALETHVKTPRTRLQLDCWDDFSGRNNGEWLTAIGQTRKQLENAVISMREYDGINPLQVRPVILGNPALSR